LEPASAPEPTGFPEPRTQPAARPPRRRGRTTLIIAAAAALGVVGGTAVGYKIQADRSPTPLAALSQAGLAYPAKSLPLGKEPAPLPVEQDNQVKTNGDLRKLLIKKPAGSQEGRTLVIADGWIPPDLYAATTFDDPGAAMEYHEELGMRRIAAVAWNAGGHREVNVALLQFRAGDQMSAEDFARDQQSYALDGGEAGEAGDLVKGSENGRTYLYKVENRAGFLPLYRAEAVAHRGDVAVDINIFDSKRISKKDIRTLAEQQMERL
jgi:hypothetical protein